MPSAASSLSPPRFTNSQWFSRTNDKGHYYCNLCTNLQRAHLESMTGERAMRHERSAKHAQKVKEFNAWEVKPDLKAMSFGDMHGWDSQGRVDRLREFVPFWQRGIEAAERGEEAEKWEDFFERCTTTRYSGPWGIDNADYDWGAGDDGWGLSAGQAWATPQDPNDGDPNHGWGISATEQLPWDIPQAQGWGPWEPSGNVAQEWAAAGTTTQRTPGAKDPSSKNRKHKSNGRNTWNAIEKATAGQTASSERKQRLDQFAQLPTQMKVQKIGEMARTLHRQAPRRWDMN